MSIVLQFPRPKHWGHARDGNDYDPDKDPALKVEGEGDIDVRVDGDTRSSTVGEVAVENSAALEHIDELPYATVQRQQQQRYEANIRFMRALTVVFLIIAGVFGLLFAYIMVFSISL